jgi:hypothetical protein
VKKAALATNSQGGSHMATYDRNAAVDYARRFWDKPGDDGVIWLMNASINVEQERIRLRAPAAEGWDARFIPVHRQNGAKVEAAAFVRASVGGETIPHLIGTWEIKTIAPWEGLADCAQTTLRRPADRCRAASPRQAVRCRSRGKTADNPGFASHSAPSIQTQDDG